MLRSAVALTITAPPTLAQHCSTAQQDVSHSRRPKTRSIARPARRVPYRDLARTRASVVSHWARMQLAARLGAGSQPCRPGRHRDETHAAVTYLLRGEHRLAHARSPKVPRSQGSRGERASARRRVRRGSGVSKGLDDECNRSTGCGATSAGGCLCHSKPRDIRAIIGGLGEGPDFRFRPGGKIATPGFSRGETLADVRSHPNYPDDPSGLSEGVLPVPLRDPGFSVLGASPNPLILS